MKVYFDKNFKKRCATKTNSKYTIGAWGDTKKEAEDKFRKIKDK